MLFCIILYCIVLYCIVLYCIVLYCIVLYCIVLYYIVLYCTVLYCIVLYKFCCYKLILGLVFLVQCWILITHISHLSLWTILLITSFTFPLNPQIYQDPASNLGNQRVRFSYSRSTDEVTEGMKRFKAWWISNM